MLENLQNSKMIKTNNYYILYTVIILGLVYKRKHKISDSRTSTSGLCHLDHPFKGKWRCQRFPPHCFWWFIWWLTFRLYANDISTTCPRNIFYNLNFKCYTRCPFLLQFQKRHKNFYWNFTKGALAASAPVYWISGMKDSHDFWVKVTNDFAAFPSCEDNIRHGFGFLEDLSLNGKYDEITSIMRTCQPITKDNFAHMLGWARNAMVLQVIYIHSIFF